MFCRLGLLAFALALCACSNPHKLAVCHGPLVVMNTDKWRPTAMEIDALDKICPAEDKQ
jgi:hypothetical protein